MNPFTLQQLNSLTGLPEKTISFWIKKYNIFQFEEDKNIKTIRFSNEDLQRLLNIATLFNFEGKYQIQDIATWDNIKLQTKVEIEMMGNLISKNINEDIINQLMAASTTYNEKRFNLIIDTALKKLTLSDFYTYIIYPYLLRIYDMFSSNDEKPAQFYYMKNLLKRKFYHLIDIEGSMVNKKNKVLLFLPENEFNEIGILFSDLLLKQAGYDTYYIGFNQNENTIKQAIADINPDIVLTYLPSLENIDTYNKALDYLSKTTPEVLLLATPKIIRSVKNKMCKKISSIEEFYNTLDDFEIKKAGIN